MEKALLSSIIIGCGFVLALHSCDKPFVEDGAETPTGNEKSLKIRLNANKVEDVSFENESPTSRSVNELEEACKRITLAIFDADNNKIKTVSETTSDKSFGHFDINISEGTYTIVVIAHNGTANPTISTPEEIKFANNKITDTFYYCGDIDVVDGQEYNITLKRATAMFRLVVKDNTPSAVKQMKFYYTGGSSTLNAMTGYGCVNSKQTEYREIKSSAYNGDSEYEVYTFPHEGDKKLKFEISALSGTSSTSTPLYTRIIEDVQMRRNTISQYSGYFYGETPEGGRGFDIRIGDEWQIENYEY